MTEQQNRQPCLDDLISHLQATREANGNIVVVLTDEDVQAPGDYYALAEFFAFWGT